MAQPLVTIIIPVYNVELYLDRCINSVLSQSLNNIEIILVDDNSPDNSSQICDDYAQKDKRIHVIHKKENEGLGMACNSGLGVATGEYVAFCDSDDWVEHEMYEKLYSEAQNNNADVVYSGIQTVDEHGNKSLMNEPKLYQVLKSKDTIDTFMLDMIASEPSCAVERLNAMSAKIVLYKRSFLERYHIQFVSERFFICEDLIWNIEVLAHATVVVTLPMTYYNYYTNSSSLSKRLRTDRFNYFKEMRKKLYSMIIDYDLPLNTCLRIDRMFIGYSRYYMRQIAASSLKRKEKVKLIKDICMDNVWPKIWSQYPINQMPIKHKIIVWLMRHKYFNVLCYVR